jgi:hypothetical protein
MKERKKNKKSIAYFKVGGGEDFECSQHKEMRNIWGEKCASYLVLISHILYMY